VLLLRAVRAQLQQGLGGTRGGGGGSEGDGAAAGAAALSPMGVPLVEELLPDSFLRHSFGLLLELLQECQAQVSRELWAEVGARLLLDALAGWLAGWLAGRLLHPPHVAGPRSAPQCCRQQHAPAPPRRRPRSCAPFCAPRWAGTTASSCWARARRGASMGRWWLSCRRGRPASQVDLAATTNEPSAFKAPILVM
jgi:hypothetical protein